MSARKVGKSYGGENSLFKIIYGGRLPLLEYITVKVWIKGEYDK